MRTRTAIASVGTLALLAAPSAGSDGPTTSHPVSVGPLRIPAAAPAAVDRRIETAWLRAEARSLGLPAQAAGVGERVADALAGRRGRGIPAAFVRFHERHRAATRCLPAAHDPFADRCGNRAPSPRGTCNWMGEATLCRVVNAPGRRVWLVVNRAGRARRFAGRGDAITAAREFYLRARARRARAAREVARRRAARRAAAAAERRAASRRVQRRRAERPAAAEQRPASRPLQRRRAVRPVATSHRARERAPRLGGGALRGAGRRARVRVPRLDGGALRAAGRACVLYRRDSEPYAFGLGMQDPHGQAAGLIAARRALGARLRRAAGVARLRDLLRALARGSRVLARMSAAASAGDLEALDTSLGRYDRAIRREARLAGRLGLRDCAG